MTFVKIFCSVLLVTCVFAYELYPVDPPILPRPVCIDYCETDECPCVDCYNPVCGKKKGATQLFASECSLNLVNSQIYDNKYWHIVADQACKVNGLCPDACLEIYDPVCAYNGVSYVTYGNDCELNQANCGNPVWGIYSYGVCPPCLQESDHY